MSMTSLTAAVRYIETQPVGSLTGCAPTLLLVLADLANEDGRSWPSVATLARRVNRVERQVQRALNALVDSGVVQRDERRGRATVYTVTPGVDVTPDTSVTPDADVTTTPDVDVTPPPTPASPAPDADVTHNPLLPLKEPAVEPSPARERAGDDFEAFWSTYPRRSAKPVALKAWAKATQRAAADVIIAGARRYADDPNREQQYTKLPATWLNGDCWDDDPLPERTSTPGRGESIQLRNRAALQRAMVLDQRPTAWDLVPTVDELRERDRLARELEERSEG